MIDVAQTPLHDNFTFQSCPGGPRNVIIQTRGILPPLAPDAPPGYFSDGRTYPMTTDPNDPALGLGARDGLPDALRVLLNDYPQAGWQADPNFDGLVRFWLSKHLSFREMLAILTRETQAAADGADPARFAAALSRIGGRLVGELHGHHGIEDAHYFPRLSAMEPRLEAGFALLDGDHHALDAHLADFVEAANALIGVADAPAEMRGEAARFAARLEGLERFLDRHLVDEEELVVPVLLHHGTGALG